MSQWFYAPLLQPGLEEFTLDEAESKHVVRVLRLGPGDSLRLVDGRGGLYDAVIREAQPRGVSLSVCNVAENYGSLSYRLHLAVAPTKQIDRYEWFLEKATEIGVHEITPLICARSERREVKIDRLEKVVVAAMKQSLKAYKPVIHAPRKFSAFLTDPVQSSLDHRRLIAHCEPGDTKPFLHRLVAPGESVTVLIGPEGDFSPAEIADALTGGYEAISLGDSRLRTETAAVAASLEVSIANRAILRNPRS